LGHTHLKLAIMQTQLYINGQWVAPVAGGTLDVINPTTATRLATVAAAGPEDVDAAVAAARSAFPLWRQKSGSDRATHLRTIATGIRTRRAELAQWETRNNGKPLPEAEWDIDDAAGCFDYYADLAEQLDAQQNQPITVPHPDFQSIVRREPVGVVGQIIPWNYPLLMAAWKVAPALAAGCTTLLKPSELTPLTALILAEIAQESGLPPGVLNVLTGDGSVGDAIARHPGINKLAFTGSLAVGSQVMQRASETIKGVTLELGGKGAILVFDDCDLDQAVEWVMFGIFWNQGEVCSATSRLLVQSGIAEALLERLRVAAAGIPIGNPLAPGTLLGPLVSKRQHERVLGYIEQGRSAGLHLLTGGHKPTLPPPLDQGYFVEPTIFVDVPTDSPLWREEIFGPVLVTRRFDTEAEAIALANDSDYGLGAAVMSGDGERADRVAAALEAGIVWVNCSQPTFTEAPWGGMKRSGIGRELGPWGLENYLEIKQVTRYTTSKPWGWYLKD
jgi:betaine-aldehyde dehydrogenase